MGAVCLHGTKGGAKEVFLNSRVAQSSTTARQNLTTRTLTPRRHQRGWKKIKKQHFLTAKNRTKYTNDKANFIHGNDGVNRPNSTMNVLWFDWHVSGDMTPVYLSGKTYEIALP